MRTNTRYVYFMLSPPQRSPAQPFLPTWLSSSPHHHLVLPISSSPPVLPSLPPASRTLLLLQYKDNEAVILWLNKIGPYHNPHETYSFYQLPFCKPPAVKGEPETREGGLGEILEGHDFIHSGMKMAFKRTFRAHVCVFVSWVRCVLRTFGRKNRRRSCQCLLCCSPAFLS